jgi:hypothetical protein
VARRRRELISHPPPHASDCASNKSLPGVEREGEGGRTSAMVTPCATLSGATPHACSAVPAFSA